MGVYCYCDNAQTFSAGRYPRGFISLYYRQTVRRARWNQYMNLVILETSFQAHHGNNFQTPQTQYSQTKYQYPSSIQIFQDFQPSNKMSSSEIKKLVLVGVSI